jgi:hypothetical protein
MSLTPEEKKRISDSYDTFEKATVDLGSSLRLGFFATARTAAATLKTWAAEIEKALEHADEPKKDPEKKP